MLTEARIKAIPKPERDALIPCGNGDGLYLRVRAATGRKTFVIRRRTQGAWRVETLGDWPKLTLLNARRKAGAAGPTAGTADAFADVADRFCEEVIDARYRSTAKETRAYFTRDCTTIAKRRFDRVRRADIVALITAKAATTPNAAAKLLVLLKQLYAWALINELIEADPTSGLTAKALKLPSYRPRERVLTDDELRALWALPEEPYGRLLRFTLLTGARIGEAMGVDATQIVGDVWTIPMTKNGRPHVVPLVATAARLLEAGWPKRDYASLHAFLRDGGYGWRAHDLRRTAATRMRDAGVSVEVIEAVLNHAPPRLVRVYQRPNMLPAMRQALETLESRVSSVVAK